MRGAVEIGQGSQAGSCRACLTVCSLASLLARCPEALPELRGECCMHLASHPSCRMHRLQQHLGAGQVSMLRDLSARAALPPGRRLPSIQVDFSLKFLLFVRISCTLPTVLVLWVRTVPLPHALHESPATPLITRGVDCHAAGRGLRFWELIHFIC